MDSADFAFLTSPTGIAALADLTAEDVSESAALALITRLRKTFTRQQAAALVEQMRLRRAATGKFGADASRMLFTRDALEQASDPAVRAYRAASAAGAGVHTVIDACCGIGSDVLAFAQAGLDVLGLDLDPVRVAIARHNAAALGLPNARFTVHDVTRGLPESADLVFFDPARRADGRRIYHVEGYQPPLSTVRNWEAQRVWAKLSPGVDLSETAAYGGTVEFISADGALKEALLQIGALPQTTSAVLVGSGDVLRWDAAPRDAGIPVSEPQAWLIEPDPAIIRAGLVQPLGAALGASLLDPEIAYLTSAARPESPWGRAWRIVDWMPFNLKALKQYVRTRRIGRITVKKRGHAMTPEALLTALKPDGHGDERVIVLTRHAGRPVIVVCLPLDSPSDAC